MKLPSLATIGTQAVHTAKRFPLPFLVACLLTAATLCEIHEVDFYQWFIAWEPLVRFLALSFLASLAGSLVAKGRGWGLPGALAVSAPLIALCGYLVLRSGALEETNIAPSASECFLAGGLVSLATLAPFLGRLKDPAAFWDFNRAAWIGVFFAILVAVVLGGGVHAILAALEALFGLRVDDKFYVDVWAVSWALVFPWRLLASMPDKFDAPADDYCPKWIGFMARYVLVPLATVYLIILYAFAAKILLQWELPRGQVAYLVCFFAVVGVLTKLVIFPLAVGQNRLLRLFDRIFGVALIVPVILLAVAVWVRVEAYGITEPRYLLILLDLWLLAVVLIMVFMARRIALVSLVLAVLLVGASIGPGGAEQVSITSQLSRLSSLLAENGALVDGRLRKPAEPMSFEARKRISSIAMYMTNNPRREGALYRWSENKGGLEVPTVLTAEAFTEALGFTFVSRYDSDIIEITRAVPTEGISYSGGLPLQLDLSGYDVLVRFSLFGQDREEIWQDGPQNRRYRGTFENAEGTLTVSDLDGRRVTFDLSGLKDDLLDGGPGPKGVSLAGSSGALKVRLLVDQLNASLDEDGNMVNIHANLVLLIGQEQGD